ncbi:helix-turn-helix domain-containing protein [Thalassobacillus devorans]|uniref:helix-turn-helix domain-containing protein n=1 Tax=Thalassobacillus devorans TaxID=279813 RepID=UPI000A1CEC14|nr:AraC family transcriptional regulator [Thalassobacillus devorans]
MKNNYPEIDQVIEYIDAHLYDSLSLSDLAAQAGYSRYHFTRIFKQRVGVPPLYYLSALRLQKAKDLLIETDFPIREIGMEIGQQSLGTFTTRFTERVGVTPAHFRHSAKRAEHPVRTLKNLSGWVDPRTFMETFHTVNGTLKTEVPFDGITLIGLFPKPIPEGLPTYGTLVSSMGGFAMTGVKPGVYYLMATSVSWKMPVHDFLLPHKTLRTRAKKPIIVAPYKEIPHQNVTLHPPKLDDPPILVSLPLLMNNFLERLRQHSNR